MKRKFRIEVECESLVKGSFSISPEVIFSIFKEKLVCFTVVVGTNRVRVVKVTNVGEHPRNALSCPSGLHRRPKD